MLSSHPTYNFKFINSLRYGLSAIALVTLQQVMHIAVHPVANLSPRDHVMPAMRELHWLIITYCIKYKLSHDECSDKQQKPSIHYGYIHSDMISSSSRALHLHLPDGFNIPCVPTEYRRAFSIVSPIVGLECASKTMNEGLTSQILSRY